MNSLNILLDKGRLIGNLRCSLGERRLSGSIAVDTGCVTTAISLYDLIPDDDLLKRWKYLDIKRYRRSGFPKIRYQVGINDEGLVRKKLSTLSDEELMSLKNIAFYRKLDNFEINGFSFGSVDVNISYDRKGCSLLGMNVLKDYDSSISLNKEGSVVFQLQNRKERKNVVSKLVSLLKSGISIEEAVSVLSLEVDEIIVWDSVKEIVKEGYISTDSWSSIEERLKL